MGKNGENKNKNSNDRERVINKISPINSKKEIKSEVSKSLESKSGNGQKVVGLNLNKIADKGEYYKELKNLLHQNEGFYSKFYRDGEGYLTIGMGTAVHNTNGWLKNEELKELFKQLSGEKTSSEEIGIVNKIMEDSNNPDKTLTDFKFVFESRKIKYKEIEKYKIKKNWEKIEYNKAGKKILEINKLLQLEGMLQKMKTKKGYEYQDEYNYEITESQAVLLMYRELKNREITTRKIATAELKSCPLYSKEMLALHSLIYNMGSNIPSTKQYIKVGSRVGAWFEIRYRSNKNKENTKNPETGLFKRRFQESNVFQLFDNLYFDNKNPLFKRDGENKVNTAISKVKYDKAKKRWTIGDKRNENILRNFLDTDKGNKVSTKEAEFILEFFNSSIKVNGKDTKVGKIMQDYEDDFESRKKKEDEKFRVTEDTLKIGEIYAFVYLKTGKNYVLNIEPGQKTC